MTVKELIKSLNEHLKTYPQDLDLTVQFKGKKVLNNLQWYPEEGYLTFLVEK